MDLPGEYNISATFNVADLSLFDVGDGLNSRTNPFEERGNDMDRIHEGHGHDVGLGLKERSRQNGDG